MPPSSETLEHDDDSNLTETAEWDHTWDAEKNRLTAAEQKSLPVASGFTAPARKRLSFAYDVQNRRLKKTVESWSGGGWNLTKDLRFVYDGWQMIAELDHTFATGTGLAGSAVNRTFLWGPDLSDTMTGAGGVGGLLSTTYQGITYQACSDANGNVTGLVPVSGAGAGTLAVRYDYDPFGNRVANAGPSVELCPFGFSSKYLDIEDNVLNYELRGHLPVLGRWMSRDPVGEAGSFNLYKTVDNDLVNRLDYLGLAVVEVALTRGQTGYFAVYGRMNVALKLKEGEEQKFACCKQLFPLRFLTMESTDTRTITPPGTYSPYFLPEASGGGKGSTSIKWKLQRGLAQSPAWWSSENVQAATPPKPVYMSEKDYQDILNLEFHIGWSGNGGGNNVHFGPSSNHSDGCVLIGSQEVTVRAYFNFSRHSALVQKNGEKAVYQAPGFGLQDTVKSQFRLFEAIQCARKNGATVKFKVMNAAQGRHPDATAIPERTPENGIPIAEPADNF